MLGVTGTGAFLRESAEKSRLPVADLHRCTPGTQMLAQNTHTGGEMP